MIGYWSADCPVRTDCSDVLATAYVKKGSALISVASWAKDPVKCRLKIDWKALGLDGSKVRLRAPGVADFQPEAAFAPDESIPVEPGRGWLFLLKETV